MRTFGGQLFDKEYTAMFIADNLVFAVVALVHLEDGAFRLTYQPVKKV